MTTTTKIVYFDETKFYQQLNVKLFFLSEKSINLISRKKVAFLHMSSQFDSTLKFINLFNQLFSKMSQVENCWNQRKRINLSFFC